MSTTKSVEPSERCFCSRESNGNLEDRCRSGLCRTTPGDVPDVNGDGPCTQSVTTTTSPVLESNNNVRCDNKLQYQGSSPSLNDEDDKSQESQEDVCFTSHKQSIQNRKLSKHVRKFYKKQNLLIDAYEQFYQNPADEESSLDVKTAKSAAFWSKVTFTTNCALLLAKITAAILSGSLVVISSMLDSAMDLVSGALMWWSNRAIKKTNYYLYPRGRRKLEPVAIVVLAVIMSFVSVQVIQESLQKIVIYSTHTYDDELAAAAGWLRNASTDDGFDASSSSSKVSGTASWKSGAEALRMTTEEASVLVTSTIYSTVSSSSSVSLESTIQLVKLLYETLDKCASQHGAPVFGLPTILICVVTIVAKLILFLICRRIPNHSVQALAKDHFNDVISNTGAVACGIIGYHLWKFADPIGAIVISVSIIINWSVTAHSQIKMLTGYTARPDFLKKVTWLALNHDDRIQYIENVIAFHFGVRYLVELKIVLPADMSLQNTHDLSEALQFKIERLPEVERAFIHTDYECDWLRRRPHQVTCSSPPPVDQLSNTEDDRCAPYIIEEDVATVEKVDV